MQQADVTGDTVPEIFVWLAYPAQLAGVVYSFEAPTLPQIVYNGRRFLDGMGSGLLVKSKTSGFYHRTPATYRIQAVWDGDEASRLGRWEDAMGFYQQVLDDETLLPWSPEFYGLYAPACGWVGPTPFPTHPAPEVEELPRLQAYARYRLLLIATLRGNLAEAQRLQARLQADFPPGQVGHPYAALAEIFLTAYATHPDLGAACQSAVQFAEAHAPDILEPLDSEHYGGYTPMYIYFPEEICPLGN